MNMTGKLGVILSWMALFTLSSRGGVIPIMQAGSETYTNVVMRYRTPTRLFFKHAGGFTNVSLQDLDDQLRSETAGLPAKEDVTVKAPPASGPEGNLSQRPGDSGGTSAGAATNDLDGRPAGTEARYYQIHGAGTLRLFVPGLWKDNAVQAQADGGGTLAIRFDRQYGDAFTVVVTALPAESGLADMGPRQVLEMTGNRSLRGAVETNLTLKDIRGGETTGSYFTITDKRFVNQPDPKPGTYRYQTQGFVLIDNFALSFAFLYNFKDTVDYRNAFEMISSAHFERRQMAKRR